MIYYNNMLSRILKPEIQEMIESKDLKSLKEVIQDWEPIEIADLLMSLSIEEQPVFFRLIPKRLSAEVFAYLESDAQEKLLKNLSNDFISKLISDLEPDDRTALFEELPGEITQKILSLLSSEERKQTLKLLGYPEDSVGRLMTDYYVKIRPNWTVGKALSHIRRFGKNAETVDMIYVVDKKNKLTDDIPLGEIVLAEKNKKIESIMDYKYIALSAYDDKEKAAKLMQKYDRVALPVVDSDNVLIGIITVDDIIDVIEEEATEDFHKGASVNPLDISYSKTTVFTLFKKRIVWLFILLVAGFLSSQVIKTFQEFLTLVIALSIFIPVIIGSGGNTGTQSAVLIIRAMTIGDVRKRDWLKIVLKEFLVGLLLGFTLGIAIFFWSLLLIHQSVLISLIAGLAIICIVIWANIVGAMLPILCYLIKIDPAIVSSPLLTTLIDSSGLLIYFSIAKLFIKM